MTQPTLADWQARAAALTLEGRAFINGQYVNAASGRVFATRNPATRQVLCQVAECGADEVNAAVSAARAAFTAGVWAEMAPMLRKRTLLRFADLLRANRDELALLETLDTGKPISDARAVDVAGAAYCVQWFAEAIDKVGGEVAPLDPKLLGLVTHEPVGVVAAIVPWNFPMLMAAWKYAPALAAGNAVILKPSEKSPLTAIRIAALAHEAGIPAGIFQVLPGDGRVGRALAEHMDVDCVAFTGSTHVGKLIAGYGAQSNLKRVWLELGGKSPNIVFDDCADLKKAAQAAAGAIYYNMGQMCTAGSRVLVQNSIKAQFLAEFKQAAERYQPGDPLDENSRMGPLVDEIQYRKVLDYVAHGKEEGVLITGGEPTKVAGKGYFLAPTAFEVAHDSKLAREEIFGPVLSIIGFDSEAEAIEMANDSDYGLGAGVWSADISRAHRVARAIRAGTVWVNCYDEGGDMNLPFGGYKQSGNGRDKSLHALEKYTELKSTLIKLA